MTSLFILTGCKVDFEVPINISATTQTEAMQKQFSMLVEVPGCSDFEDSRKESESLIDMKEKISQALPIAKYKECFRKGMDSFAEFYVPFTIIPRSVETTLKSMDTSKKDKFNSLLKDSAVLLFVDTPDKLNNFEFGVKKPFRKKMAEIEKKVHSKLTFTINLSFKNDTKQNYTVLATAPVYINGKAFHPDASVNLAPQGTTLITLSDVTTDALFNIDNPAFLNFSVITEEKYKEIEQQAKQKK